MKQFIIAALGTLLASTTWADSWRSPTPMTYTSSYGTYRLTVFPSGLDGHLPSYEDKVAGTEAQAGCEAVLERLDGNEYRRLWRMPLVNRVSPVSALISDKDGSFVTFDNWHHMGWGDDAIVIYGGDGQLKRQFALTSLMSQAEFDRLPRSVSSLQWSGEHAINDGKAIVYVQIATEGDRSSSNRKYRTVRIRLDTAEVID